MNLFESIKHAYTIFLHHQFAADNALLKNCSFELNTEEAKAQFGDINSNAAMILAKQLKNNPQLIARTIIDTFKHNAIASIEMAGPGFINFFLTPEAFHIITQDMFEHKKAFFIPDKPARPRVSLEFVSANPTGPLHFGHGRGGIIGDVLSNIMCFVGYSVNKEFYINDAGAQMHKLGNSLIIRCKQVLGEDAFLPEDAYHGEYMIALANTCIQEHGPSVINNSFDFFVEYAKTHLLAVIKATLAFYGIHFDTWFSEKTLHDSGAIDTVLAILKERGYLYEKEGALWFKATAFADDKDRVVKKSSGELTYVAADVAYMQNKIDRGADQLIMILGHDHHSYVVRLHAVQQALGLEQYPLHIILYQLVKMKNEGQLVRMSKRAGTIVTLHDVIEAVGPDVARFFFLNRKADAQLEFDIALALTKTEENPVYYIQYAYVRTLSILEKAEKALGITDVSVDDCKHIGDAEKLLIKKIASLKDLLTSIAENHQTHLLTYYIQELAQLFHNYYAHSRILDPADMATSRARVLMTIILRDTFSIVLELLGISRPQKM